MSIDTPILDSQLPSLLHQITQQGGYAFTSITGLGAAPLRALALRRPHLAGRLRNRLPSRRQMPFPLRRSPLALDMGGFTLRDDLNLCIRKATLALRDRDSTDDYHRKAAWYEDFNFAEATRLLPAKSLSSKAVVKKCGLSMEGFLQEHFVPSLPVIISGSMNHWPATDRWSDMNYI